MIAMMENEVAVKCKLVEWKEYSIKDLGTVVTGNTPPKKDPENYGGNLVWIKPPDLDKKMFVSSSEETISEIGKKKARLLPKGSVLVSCIGNIGKIAIADCELCTNQQINSIIPNEEIVDSVFLYYTIKRMKFYLEKVASSAVVPLLNKHDFSEIKIKIPPIETQKKIVEIIEKVEKLKEWRVEADELANEYLKSIFLEMFGDPVKNEKGWEITNFKEIASIDKKSIKAELINENSNYVGLEHLESGTGKILEISSAKIAGLKSNKYLFDDDCVLYGKLRPYLNKVALPTFKGVCSTDILPIRPKKDKSNKYFIKSLLSLDYYIKKATEQSTGANLPRISPKAIESFKVYSPPMELQNQFAQIVQQVEDLKNYQSESKQEINNLFNTLMQKAFKGELVC